MRLPDYSTTILWKYEITITSLYLTKDDFLRKHKKSELATSVYKPLECLSDVQMCNKKAMIKVDFIAYARKVPVKKAKLKTYGDLEKPLWNTFNKLVSDYARIDIIFDLSIIYSIKETERNRRNAEEEISKNMFGSEQQLPIDTNIFWAVSENKMKFQQFFIDWLT